MEHILKAVKFVIENHQLIIEAALAVLAAVIAVCVLIPGEQPEKTLQKVVDFIAKLSRKPKA